MVGLKKLLVKILQQVPFRFGIDADGNYGYYKKGADTVTPFNQVKKGTSTFSAYAAWTNVECGFKPRIIMAYCQTGTGPYLITWFYYEGVINTSWRKSTPVTQQNDLIEITNTGFRWKSIDSTWGTQTITYVAAR